MFIALSITHITYVAIFQKAKLHFGLVTVTDGEEIK